ncbi:MAG TPA: AtpZ/AtpI family protein [Tepidisphaeraceae bacterium]|nr:AtpZ/AtpI family protein [Tepidisphaeraceae bacterium]
MPPTPADPPQREHSPSAGRSVGAGAGKASGEDEATLASWYRMAGVGIEFVVAVGLFAAVGYGLDRWLNTQPWLLLIGMFLGFAVGMRAMIRLAKKSFRE